MSDLFPTIKAEDADYGLLDKAIRRACENQNLKDVDGESLAPASQPCGCPRKGWPRPPWERGTLMPGQRCCGLGLSGKQSAGQGRSPQPGLQGPSRWLVSRKNSFTLTPILLTPDPWVFSYTNQFSNTSWVS